MTKIFIEAEKRDTPEHYFLQSIINVFFPEKDVDFIYMKGIGNLFNQAIINQIKLAQETGEQVIVIVDADTVAKGYGYNKRKEEIEKGMATNSISFSYFIYPNNNDNGESIYNIPNLKGKVYAYAAAQTIYDTQQKQRKPLIKKMSGGNWLFDNKDYWNLNVDVLQPLKDFLKENLK